MKTTNETARNGLQPKTELTTQQLSAVDSLASGKIDSDVAKELNLSRTTVWRWRTYDPDFQAALNARRQEIWAASGDKLRALTTQALAVIEETFKDPTNPGRLKAAIELLRLTRPEGLAPTGPTDPEQIVRERTQAIREHSPDRMDLRDAIGRGSLPRLADHMAIVKKELKDLAASAES
ncbi:MAG: hypothetical protein ACJ8C4_17605 [Gemmataceae bacterium]